MMYDEPEQNTMPFGKHRGKPLSEVPRNYLAFVLDWPELWPDTRLIVLAELRRRGLPFGRFKDVALDEVPRSYLEWVQANFDTLLPPYDQLVEDVLAEVANEPTPVVPTSPPPKPKKTRRKLSA
jgi:uncharacterized protein (DUF3820 family)